MFEKTDYNHNGKGQAWQESSERSTVIDGTG